MQAQLSVVHQLTGDYRSGFTAICDATIALLIYAVKWAFISKSVGELRIGEVDQLQGGKEQD